MRFLPRFITRSREYERLRDEGVSIEQAMVFLGHTFSMWHLRYQSVG